MNQVDLQDLEIKIYPLVLYKSPAAKLWHLCRALDSTGSGKASLTLDQVKFSLGISKATFFRYLHSDLFHKFFSHKNSLNQRVYSIYYLSLKKVKELWNLSDVVTRGFGLTKHISKSQYRQTSCSIVIESLQSNSCYKAQIEKSPSTIVIKPAEFFSEDSSISGKTQGIKLNEFGLFIDATKIAHYGASQSTAALILHSSTRTVNSLLSNTLKLRQFVSSPLFTFSFYKSRWDDDFSWSRSSPFFLDFSSPFNSTPTSGFSKGPTVFKRYCCLYYPQWSLSRKRLSGWPLKPLP